MGTTAELSKTKPFHESIVDEIRRMNELSEDAKLTGLGVLAHLIMRTKIPKNHNAIAEAWKDVYGMDDLGVVDSLEEQKKAAEEKSKSAGEKKSVNLDDLQQEVEKLLALLKDRQPGLITWNGFMQERLQALHKLTSAVVGK
ncbi:MAG: hypothetical protein A2427_03040 [Candidatus Nealsonbacteria bacterium RIFOXYC1_FULL_40_7]|uniref:Uncharacterized protein n=1 Tax=Candidatus Nealsonbacteria bacterium RIFOXYC1_FULL_40_7 TaxID=1801678 RepID=A0A1G2EVD1_9BACT|nr:MAG: hypothetical protein A2427_03040 [Candidatus Nealsonbacteria bacterium RIFOXYC1_FULL_40_7]OGZ29591.1 MAG: hypothetical protein A2562_03090 [Candidatus Nealsonbacteria bacterium RIFOXYD1_FULL_39_11]